MNVIPSKAEVLLSDVSLEEVKRQLGDQEALTAEVDGPHVRITATGISRHAAFPEGAVNAVQVLAAGEGLETDMEDGEYSIQVDLEGGSGKASVTSPALMIVKDGRMYAQLQWSSSNYDYMIVNEEKILNESEEGRNSVFTVPVTVIPPAGCRN